MSSKSVKCIIVLSLFLLPYIVAGDCTCDHEESNNDDAKVTVRYRVWALAAILAASALGVSLPILGKNISWLNPESKLFFLVKSFAAGVILSTGFIHVLPDAFEDLTSPCLKNGPWKDFPFTGLAAMAGSLGTLMIDAFATGYFRKIHFKKPTTDEEEGTHAGHVHLHTHATHGHSHGATPLLPDDSTELDRLRYKVTSQVLEMGIVVHSVIIGLSLGTSQSLGTIKPLMAALCFHQFFEGMGLGGCIAQASFKSLSTWCMSLFFSLTTPLGIAIGLGISNAYDESSPTALIVQGLLNAVAAGILIYMALVDLLAQDFMSPKAQTNSKLFLGANATLLLGAGCMSVLAIWA